MEGSTTLEHHRLHSLTRTVASRLELFVLIVSLLYLLIVLTTEDSLDSSFAIALSVLRRDLTVTKGRRVRLSTIPTSSKRSNDSLVSFSTVIGGYANDAINFFSSYFSDFSACSLVSIDEYVYRTDSFQWLDIVPRSILLPSVLGLIHRNINFALVFSPWISHRPGVLYF